MNPSQRIITLVRREYVLAEENFRRAHAERVGTDAAANAWDEYCTHDTVGGFSQSPHNTQRASEREQRAKEYYQQMKDTYEHAVDVFLEGIPS